jgi:hypothetical protein
MKSLIAALLLVAPGFCFAAFAGCAHWPTTMAIGNLTDARITRPELLDESRTRPVLLALEKIRKNLYRQIYEITFYEKSGREIKVITSNQASPSECSISGVLVWVVSEKLGME